MSRILAIVMLCLLAGGCAQFEKVPAKYSGLAGQPVAVMVWAAPQASTDFTSLQLDVARGVQSKLQQAAAESVELKNITFPLKPEAIWQYQQNYPQIQVMPIERVAPKFEGITRLIYLEISEVRTRTSEAVLNLYRGRITGSVKVIQIENGVGKLAYEETDIIAVYPKDAPDAGTPNLDDYRAYRGAVDAFTTEVAIRFFAHYAN